MSFKHAKAEIESMAAEAFTEHSILILTNPGVHNPKSPYVFQCAKKGTNNYSFTILFGPGVICVWGDLGEWILRHSDGDSIGWLLRAVESPDYLLGKIKAGEGKVFYPEEACNLLQDMIKEAEKASKKEETRKEDKGEEEENFESDDDIYSGYDLVTLGEVEDNLGCEWDLTEHWWHQIWHEAGADEVPPCLFPSSGALWLIEIFKCFTKLYPSVSQLLELWDEYCKSNSK